VRPGAAFDEDLGMTSRPLRVLLVDDHAVLREGLRALLEGGDEEIEVVGESGTTDHGLNAALALRPDVVLLDLSLPGRPAARVIDELRHRAPAVRVVVLTATLDPQLVRDTLAAGASGFLLKEITRRGLVSALRSAVAGEVVLHPEVSRALEAAGGASASDGADAKDAAEERRPRAADLFA
jgi:DNA-binding NarL/FixJ family response regulator